MKDTNYKKSKQATVRLTALMLAGALAGGLAGYGISRTGRPKPPEPVPTLAPIEEITEPTCRPLVLEYPEITDVTLPPMVRRTVLPEGTDLERDSWEEVCRAIMEALEQAGPRAIIPEERGTYEELTWREIDMNGDQRPEFLVHATAYNETDQGRKKDWINRRVVYSCQKTENGYTAVQAEDLIDGVEMYETADKFGFYMNPGLAPDRKFDLILYTLEDGQIRRTYHAPFDFVHRSPEFEAFVEVHPYIGWIYFRDFDVCHGLV